MRVLIVLALASACAGCATAEAVQFRPGGNQQGMTRDGQPALVSRGKNSIVLVRPASRQFTAGGRPVFVVAINNIGRQPVDFRVASVQATQTIYNQVASLQVITFEQLQTEERNRQIAAAILVGVAAGANAAAASQAGYYNRTSTVTTPRGTYQVNTSGYSPTANAIAQTNAAIQNEAMISATIDRGQQNLALLERDVIKDNTLMPGEWYGGQLHLQTIPAGRSRTGLACWWDQIATTLTFRRQQSARNFNLDGDSKMSDDNDREINSLKIEIDRLAGHVAALSAYIAFSNLPNARMNEIIAVSRDLSPKRLASGGPGSPGDHAEFYAKRVDDLAKKVAGLA